MAQRRENLRKKAGPADGLDPRLVEIARYLARRAAERDYEAFRKGLDQPAPGPAERREAT